LKKQRKRTSIGESNWVSLPVSYSSQRPLGSEGLTLPVLAFGLCFSELRAANYRAAAYYITPPQQSQLKSLNAFVPNWAQLQMAFAFFCLCLHQEAMARARDAAEGEVGHLPSMHRALNSIPSTVNPSIPTYLIVMVSRGIGQDMLGSGCCVSVGKDTKAEQPT
jgi:hypothetical protein